MNHSAFGELAQGGPSDLQVPSRRGNPQRVTTSWFDLPGPVPLRKSYVIASTPRCGSTLLSSLLWQSGVLGAPAEYWNFHKRARPVATGTKMMERLEASSPADYLTKLLACRTTRNGVFGAKAHFVHFEEAIERYPEMLDVLAPVTYIHIDREDKVAQAVSLAKLVQHGCGWRERPGQTRQRPTEAVPYDREVIALCLQKLEQQRAGWLRWFEANHIDPIEIKYEKLAADRAGVIRGIMDTVGVQNDEPQAVRFKTIERQSDRTNQDWVARFKRDTDRAQIPVSLPETTLAETETSAHLLDRFEQIRANVVGPRARKGRFLVRTRSRRQYEGIIGHSRGLFRDSSVLNINCGDGRWSLAALDAGARYVVGLETGKRTIDIATRILSEFGFDENSYQFVRQGAMAGLQNFDPGAFDLVLCDDLEGISDPYGFFSELFRLQPKHVILDTAVNRIRAKRTGLEGKRRRPVATFKLLFSARRKGKDEDRGDKKRFASMTFVPNHELIVSLSEHFGFVWRKIDWQNLGLADWIGVTDYELGRRQTYVLDRA